MITGTLTETATAKTFTATISTLLFDLTRIAVTPNAYKTADNHPDYQLEIRTPRGRTMRIGSMWKAIRGRVRLSAENPFRPFEVASTAIDIRR